MPNRQYRHIPSDAVERARQLRAEGRPLRAICEAIEYPDFRYVSKITLGQRRQGDAGPITPKSTRPLTQAEREIIQENIAHNLHIYGKSPGSDTLSRIIGHNRGGCVRERGRIEAWVARMVAYVDKQAAAEHWFWKGGVRERLNSSGVAVPRPRFMDGANKEHDPRKWLYTFWTGRKLSDNERLKFCIEPLCCNPAHHSVIPVKAKAADAA